MDFEERRSYFGKGSYIWHEGSFLLWVFFMTLLNYRRKLDGFEITRPSQPSKCTCNVQKMFLLLFYIFYHTS